MYKNKKIAHTFYIKKGMCIYMDKKEKAEIDSMSMEVGEDATKYGEFISSYFAWISLPNQKEKAEELENMTKKKDKKR